MRVAVVDSRNVPLMPCTSARARHLLKAGHARPKRSKLGLFYIQLVYEQEPDNQSLVAGVDPGATYEGYSVVGTKDTVLNLMVEAPIHVKKAVETRRTMRRARRFRKWRRPKRIKNRYKGKRHIPPSTRSRWEAKARVIAQLAKILPLTDIVVEDVQALTRRGKQGKWNLRFSPVQVSKSYLYHLLAQMGLTLHFKEGWQTKELREQYGLKKSSKKGKPEFETHAIDAWVLAASVSGAAAPTSKRLWYIVPHIVHRRQLHRLKAAKGGIRKPYGGTSSLSFKRGTRVWHPNYGLCTVGGYDRTRQTMSLHAYRTNTRLTQGGKTHQCKRLTTIAFRGWFVRGKLVRVPVKAEG